MKNHNNLIAPANFWTNSPSNISKYINGCGGSGLTSKLVPNSLLGLDISEACAIHDYMYATKENKNQEIVKFFQHLKPRKNQK